MAPFQRWRTMQARSDWAGALPLLADTARHEPRNPRTEGAALRRADEMLRHEQHRQHNKKPECHPELPAMRANCRHMGRVRMIDWHGGAFAGGAIRA